MKNELPNIVPFKWDDRIVAARVIDLVGGFYHVELPGMIGFFSISTERVAELYKDKFNEANKKVGLNLRLR